MNLYRDESEKMKIFESETIGIFDLIHRHTYLNLSDAKLAEAIYQIHLAPNSLLVANQRDRNKRQFSIRHYTWEATYALDGFIGKNKCRISNLVIDAIKVTRNNLLRRLPLPCWLDSDMASSTGAPNSTTRISIHRRDFDFLMRMIRDSHSNFVRCLRPNESSLAGKWTLGIVMGQCTSGKVFQTAKLMRSELLHNLPFHSFVSRYSSLFRICGTNPITRDVLRFKDRLKAHNSFFLNSRTHAGIMIRAFTHILRLLSVLLCLQGSSETASTLTSGIVIGRTKVFIQKLTFQQLEILHLKSQHYAATYIKHRWLLFKRCYHQNQSRIMEFLSTRSKLLSQFRSQVVIQQVIQVWFSKRKYKKIRRSIIFLQSLFRKHLARKLLLRKVISLKSTSSFV